MSFKWLLPLTGDEKLSRVVTARLVFIIILFEAHTWAALSAVNSLSRTKSLHKILDVLNLSRLFFLPFITLRNLNISLIFYVRSVLKFTNA